MSLAVPVFQDGTIDLTHLLHRLHRVGPQLGPLDLVQALYRLRPSDPARAGDLDLPPVMTVPELTAPDGSESWDAAAMVRSWVAAGGAGPAEAGREGGPRRRWTVRYPAPVPWSTCRAAPAGLDEQVAEPESYGPTVRVFPLQPDRVALHGRYADGSFLRDFVRMDGGFGPTSARFLLSQSAEIRVSPSEDLLDLLAALAGKELIDPAAIGETARLMTESQELELSRLIESWRLVFCGGGLAALWPMALAVTEGLAAMEPPPLELAQLVGLLVEFAPEVPSGAGVDRVLALAGRMP